MKFVISIILGVVVMFAGFGVPAFAKKVTSAPAGSESVQDKLTDKKAQAKEKKAQAKADAEAKKLEKKEQEAAKKAEKVAKKAAKKNNATKDTKAEETTSAEKKVKSVKQSKDDLTNLTPIEREQKILEERRLDATVKRSKIAKYLNPNLGIREIRASHILVSKRKEAVKIRKDIKNGVITFEDAAKQYSMCPSSVNGGDLGYFDRRKMEPLFSEIAFDLDIGEISEPVGTKFGWHIIKTTDKR